MSPKSVTWYFYRMIWLPQPCLDSNLFHQFWIILKRFKMSASNHIRLIDWRIFVIGYTNIRNFVFLVSQRGAPIWKGKHKPNWILASIWSHLSHPRLPIFVNHLYFRLLKEKIFCLWLRLEIGVSMLLLKFHMQNFVWMH